MDLVEEEAGEDSGVVAVDLVEEEEEGVAVGDMEAEGIRVGEVGEEEGTVDGEYGLSVY